MSLKDWLPDPNNSDDFYGRNVSEDERKGWREGRASLCGWYKKLTLWERLKIAWRGYLIGESL